MSMTVRGGEQLIVVEAGSPSSFRAALSVYEKTGEHWIRIMNSIPAVIGKNGMSDDKMEGDGKTPIGLYELGEAFGTKHAPDGIAMPYRQVTKYDYWIDDPHSVDYNRPIYYEGNPSSRWQSFERLTHPLYSHAIVIRYNDNPVVKGKGSAIFIHEWKNESSPTLGCIAVSYNNLVRLLRLLNPAKKPEIRIEPPAS
jgi:L,D-peptidoglycan transpeptidase YkuD (ErfK/YbiS/YcfS/YnhG family)